MLKLVHTESEQPCEEPAEVADSSRIKKLFLMDFEDSVTTRPN